MSRIKFLLPLLLCVILICGCSKEAKVSRHLTGEWIIDRYTIEFFEDGQSVGELQLSDAGTIIMEKGGSGSVELDVQNIYYYSEVEWSNTEDELTLIYLDNTGTEVWDIISNSRKQIALETYVEDSTDAIRATMFLVN